MKVFIWRIVVEGRTVTLPSKAGDPARQVSLLAGSTLCFLCKHSTTPMHLIKNIDINRPFHLAGSKSSGSEKSEVESHDGCQVSWL